MSHDKNSPWENLRVANPCKNKWDAMDGSQHVRKCRECSLNVYDLSEITEEQAGELIRSAEGELPARFYRRSDGTIMTSDCPHGKGPSFGDQVKELFGKVNQNVWRNVAAELDGRFVDGGLFDTDFVYVRDRDWMITLDLWADSGSESARSNRLRAAFFSEDRFRFTVYRRNFLTDIAVAFGMQDIVVGDPGFDRDFIIKANDVSKVQALFANAEIRDLVWAHEDIRFEIEAKFPSRTGHLVCSAYKPDISARALIGLFRLMSITLDQLVVMGSARPWNSGDR
jgi:hypothetical protein